MPFHFLLPRGVHSGRAWSWFAPSSQRAVDVSFGWRIKGAGGGSGAWRAASLEAVLGSGEVRGLLLVVLRRDQAEQFSDGRESGAGRGWCWTQVR